MTPNKPWAVWGAPVRRKPSPDPEPWEYRAYIWLLMLAGRLLQWDYARRERWHGKLQVWNLKARNHLINHLADVTNDEQLKIM